MGLRDLTWNLFHGRSEPETPRSLLPEFTAMLAGWEWDVALLQEALPWWPAELARASRASMRMGVTSPNGLPPPPPRLAPPPAAAPATARGAAARRPEVVGGRVQRDPRARPGDPRAPDPPPPAPARAPRRARRPARGRHLGDQPPRPGPS